VVNEISIRENLTEIVNLSLPVKSTDLVVADEAVDNLMTEGGEDFYNYVKSIGLAKDTDLIVLSSRHGYYYDVHEMKNVRTVINLKELNKIKQIKSLFKSYLHFLPNSCNFVGCFVNNKKVERFVLRNSSDFIENRKCSDAVKLGIFSTYPFINKLYSIMDLRTNTYMSERSVFLLLKDHGYKVMDMTEFNGRTFFHSKRVVDSFN
jgi:hypothetical protein